jgi:Cupredoxin-like domain
MALQRVQLTPQLCWAALCLILVFAAACGSGLNHSATTTPPPTPLPGRQITIEGLDYGSPLTVAPGTQIIVANADDTTHTVTSDTPGLFDAHVDGQIRHATFQAPNPPGVYPFHCKQHPAMHGTLIVQ